MQVRLLVGALKCVGTGELSVADGTFLSPCREFTVMGLIEVEQCSTEFVYGFASVKRILEAKAVSAAKPMAPASGLYLGRVKCEFP